MNSIDINNFSFNYPNGEKIIKNISLTLTPGDITLLVGHNGSGKTTLLRILAGKHLVNNQDVLILGKDVFHNTSLNYQRSFIDHNWGSRTIAFAGNNIAYSADILVKNMMKSLQDQFPKRRDILLDVLGIDLEWKMHLLSDGQRRRVQIFLGLLRPIKILLLDEVTSNLDIICREKLFDWLKLESQNNQMTIVFATHIFDGLDGWASKLLYMKPNGNLELISLQNI